MQAGTDQRAVPTGVGAEARAVGLLKRARLSAWGALVTEAALLGLFLWGVNPNNLVYSLSVLAQSEILFALAAIALLLPVLTLVWVGWILQSVRGGDWTEARRWLPAIVVLGYLSLIGPGFYTHETLHLLDSPSWSDRTSSVAI
ncbi:MAG: hypothetical protein WCB19_02770 [Thermoplasmata archaeon]